MTHTVIEILNLLRIFNLSETNFVQMDPKTGIWNRSNGNTTARVLCVSDGCYTGMNLTLNSTNCHKKVQNYQLKAASNFCSNIRMIYPEGMSLTRASQGPFWEILEFLHGVCIFFLDDDSFRPDLRLRESGIQSIFNLQP